MCIDNYRRNLVSFFFQSGDGGLRLDWRAAGQAVANYVRGIGTGTSFLFKTGSAEHTFFHEISGYALVSFAYSAAAE
jgi:hypothetical protein